MKILITGGAGFIGSNIADAFVSAGHRVAILDNLSSGKRVNINPKAKFYKADITSAEIEKIFRKEKFDIVCHHAAQIDVRKSVSDPAFDAEVNILGTINILENSVKYKVGKVIFASSGGTIYGECGSTPPNEESKANPLSPYGISKYSVEFYIKYYQAVHGLKYTVLRYANVYGPRQDPHGEAGVVAIFSGKIIENAPIKIFGNGKQMRDYVYVSDVVKANLLSLRKGDNQIINIGTKETTSVNKLFYEMAKLTFFKQKPLYKPARQGELFKSYLDIKKANRLLGWKPQVSLQDGLRETIGYFRKNK